jgi:phosphatidylserine/phosphatidylglycerophosphate/cardiolipin synthase-like enzyme
VDFSPGDGVQIAGHIAGMIAGARRRIKLCSMILTSGAVLGALADALDDGQVGEYGGVYDRTQMEGVVRQWAAQGGMEGKIRLFERVAAPLSGKRSTPYAPDSPHDFMHNKVVVCDDVVLTGSFNFSNNATRNAENVLKIYSADVAGQYCAYIDRLAGRYR